MFHNLIEEGKKGEEVNKINDIFGGDQYRWISVEVALSAAKDILL